ncbi:MAG: hypothetical protein AUF76_04780 [Acidobacteria bacterium 13_1_20CM_2_65_9]|nr:MAG: hypothetical protein AUF76_04780 [Acidobacteria bacterium 13_1_20CM_2_65_9]
MSSWPGFIDCDSRSTPTPARIASPRIASIMQRDGTRMKFSPGSQYTSGQRPIGGPSASHTLTIVSSA